MRTSCKEPRVRCRLASTAITIGAASLVGLVLIESPLSDALIPGLLPLHRRALGPPNRRLAAQHRIDARTALSGFGEAARRAVVLDATAGAARRGGDTGGAPWSAFWSTAATAALAASAAAASAWRRRQRLKPRSVIDVHALASPGPDTEVVWPTRAEVIAEIPKECFEPSALRSMGYLVLSASLTALTVAVGKALIPLAWWTLPAWALYSAVCGTVATGLWVIAHECGHGAFSKSKSLNDAVGYVLHSIFLVPYFSWQRSHAVHHANTNHMERGQTHVPKILGRGSSRERLFRKLSRGQFGALIAFVHLVIGWPAYLIAGVTSGPRFGTTNHFWPYKPFNSGELDLFPGRWKSKVIQSAIGVFGVLGLLAWWASKAGVAEVLALYWGPYLVVNFWLVAITWLQHTHHELPHYGDEDFTWVKGAFGTVDRNWGWLLDRLHHKITTTHVAHHVCERIPHYHAERATQALRSRFPALCRRDDTPFLKALWGTVTSCVFVAPVQGTRDTYQYQYV